MHLLAISLLTILAGTLLLAKFKKEMPGKCFAFISWFFIVVGFILFIGFIGGAICKMKHHCSTDQKNCQHEMMMKNCKPGMRGDLCCPQGMDKEMCSKKARRMSSDSTMKGCPKHMAGDSTKISPTKK